MNKTKFKAIPTEAKSRKLRSKWYLDAAFDISSIQGTDILAKLLENQIKYENPEYKFAELV